MKRNCCRTGWQAAIGTGCLVWLTGCTGVVNGNVGSGPHLDANGNLVDANGNRVDANGTPLDANGNPTGGNGGGTNASCTGPVDPGFNPVRLLTSDEYSRTVQDLTGIDPLGKHLITPESATTTFDRSSQTFSFSGLQASSFMDVAESAAQAVIGTAESRAKFLGCEPSAPDCLSHFAVSFGRRAFRRALSQEEVTALVTLSQEAKDDPNPYAGAGLIVRAVLQSPKFLMHIELGTAEPGGKRFKLTGPELASRLSYLLLGTLPSDALLANAEKGGLDAVGGVEAATREMLATNPAHAQLRSFFSQWFGLSRLQAVTRDATAFPAWNDGLRQSMQEETLKLVDDFVWTDGQKFIDVLDTPQTFVDANLAKLYGVSIAGSGFQKVGLGATPRLGLLTQPSLLTLTAGGDVTPIRRGKFIRDTLLCKPPPQVPAAVPDLPPIIPGQTQRQRLESHRTNPACAACHTQLDPLGFGLSRFDDIGAYREVDASGNAISDQGVFPEATPPEFHGPKELAAKLRATGDFQACVVERLVEFSLARNTQPTDACVSQSVNQAFASSNYDFRSAVVALVRSDAFRYRRDPAKEEQAP